MNELARLKVRLEEKDKIIDRVRKDHDRLFMELKSLKIDNEKR